MTSVLVLWANNLFERFHEAGDYFFCEALLGLVDLFLGIEFLNVEEVRCGVLKLDSRFIEMMNGRSKFLHSDLEMVWHDVSPSKTPKTT